MPRTDAIEKPKRLATSVALFAFGALVVTGCGGDAEPAAGPTATATVTATVTATPEPVADESEPADEPADEEAVEEAEKKAPEPVLTAYTMPNTLGVDLQSAQEAVKDLLGVPVWPLLRSHDVLEGWRLQVLDAHWKVCGQEPAPGETFTEETIVDFGVVKLAETCP
ncbi:hypothetical protein [Nocardioides yefusunii]|uniref:PASTA domain-containing protein n=1 Tax=Nocardioides yefusunii TaxID=2500546 RepID=A0ABW1QWS1_9ACTN|nr:hypothetical protein [Nocardioides yefusunii]